MRFYMNVSLSSHSLKVDFKSALLSQSHGVTSFFGETSVLRNSRFVRVTASYPHHRHFQVSLSQIQVGYLTRTTAVVVFLWVI